MERLGRIIIEARRKNALASIPYEQIDEVVAGLIKLRELIVAGDLYTENSTTNLAQIFGERLSCEMEGTVSFKMKKLREKFRVIRDTLEFNAGDLLELPVDELGEVHQLSGLVYGVEDIAKDFYDPPHVTEIFVDTINYQTIFKVLIDLRGELVCEISGNRLSDHAGWYPNQLEKLEDDVKKLIEVTAGEKVRFVEEYNRG